MTILQQYLEANRRVDEEFASVELELVSGTVPADLRGTLYRNGPGRLEHQGVLYQHLFDGDGMVMAFSIVDGKIRYRNRFVRTREFTEEEAAGRMLHRSFGTNIPGGFWRNMLKMRFKNAANTSVIYHGGKLLALWEGGWPHELDPETLETVQRYDYDGVLRNDTTVGRWIMPELPFAAHPRLHPDTGELHNFGTATGAKQELLLYRVDPQGAARIDRRITMEQLYFTHDYVLTAEGQHIFFFIPVAFELWKALLGLEPPVETLLQQPDQPIHIMVIDDEGITEYETDYCFIFHFVNGYRNADGTLVVDAFTMPDFPLSFDLHRGLAGEPVDSASGNLTRFYLTPGQKQARREPLSDYPGEFPAWHPDRTGKPYRYAWGIGNPSDRGGELLHGIVKYDLAERQTRFRDYYPGLTGEPIFVPRPGATAEDDGWLLFLTFDPEADSTELQILTAADLEPVATARLPHHVPLVFHGTWVDSAG